LNDVETSEAEKTKRTKTRTRQKKRFPKSPFDFQRESLVLASELKPKPNGRFIQNTIAKLIQSIDKRNFSSEWKSTFKEEFVTAGGINLKKLISKPWKASYMKTCISQVKS
jgi:predicted flavoprotein YhiN